MFSFFHRKKNSPDSAEEGDPIPGPDANPQDGNDFIFVERKDQTPIPSNSIYPPMPGIPYPPQQNTFGGSAQRSQAPVNFLDGIPFQIASELCQEDTLEVVQLEVDGILALMTKRLQFDQADYDFALEREISGQ